MTTFKSSFARAFLNFVDWKRAQDLKYVVGERRLSYFDSFLADQKIESLVLTTQFLQDYRAILTSRGKSERYCFFLVAQDFARYYQQIVPESATVETMPFKKPKAGKPFIFTLDHIHTLMRAARELEPVNTIRPHVMVTLIGLLYVSGMRIGEALRLTLEDFQSEPYRLFIAKSKFGKDRWVVLKDSTALALKAYLKVRQSFARQASRSFFLNQYGGALSYGSVQPCFHLLLDQCLIEPDCKGSRPKLHSLRHSFAINNLV